MVTESINRTIRSSDGKHDNKIMEIGKSTTAVDMHDSGGRAHLSIPSRYDPQLAAESSDCKPSRSSKNTDNNNIIEKERTPPSIPSRYDAPRANEAESESNAFGTRTCRFHNMVDVTPGPGAYHKAPSYEKDPSSQCGSVSVRGYTTMISKTQRFESCNNSYTPGPGAYEVAAKVAVQVGIANSHFFVEPRHSKRGSNAQDTPGPGHYDMKGICQPCTPFGSSAFKSTERTGGSSIINNISTAAVGSYDVAKSLDTLQNYGRDDRHGKPFPSASFASGSKRKADINPATITPGPGYYCRVGIDPRENESRANAVIRVSLRKVLKPYDNAEYSSGTPGPGWYFSDCENTKSKGITSVFKSHLPRFPNEHMSTAPGPAYYRPKILEKRAILMNKDQRWV